MPTSEGTVTVTYVGSESFIYGKQVVKPGDTIDLPAEEVQSWGDTTPSAFQKQ